MASTYLSRTYGTPTSTQKWTASFWIKRGDLGREQHIFGGASAAQCYFVSNNTLRFSDSTAGTNYYTTQVFRDTSAWYHFVIAVDTTLGTAGDRARIYVNGSEITSFSTETDATQNNNSGYNVSGTSYAIGRYNPSQASDYYFNGSYSHIHFIDGTAYDADTFGSTDATTGIWKPKTAPSVTYGTNGFFLKGENSSALGTDSSGNGNNFTVNGTPTQTIDTPSNVFATYNPLGNAFPVDTFSNGNTTQTTNAGNFTYNTSTLGASDGKYYCEIKNSTNNNNCMGIVDRTSTSTSDELTGTTYGWGYVTGGQIYSNGSIVATYNSVTTNDIIGIALDLDNNKVYFSKNGTWQGSSDPSAGTGGISITDPASNRTGFYFFASGDSATNSAVNQANFGNGFFGTTAVASAQNPDDGIGIFEFSVPTNYRALCTESINAEEYS